MAFSRSLLIKGAAGLTTCAAGGVVIHQRENIFGKRAIDLNSLTDKQLIDNVGLDCGLGDGVTEVTESKDCSVKTGGKINVKKGKQKEEGVSFTNGDSTKLKVSRSEEGGYSKKLKFVVDSGDITLTKTEAGSSSSISKLGQYETYEISNEGDKWYLSLEDSAEEAKTKILVLPKDCTLPADSTTKDCTLSGEQVKAVNFSGKTDGSISLSGDTKLTIAKVTEGEPFTEGYKLTFTFPSDVTISTDNTVKGNIPTDFKIKKENNTLSLEKAWTPETLAKKIGITCPSSSPSDCSISSSSPSTLNVKVGSKKAEGKTAATTGGGKIKVEKDQQGYNQGFKFTIDTASFTLTGGSGDQTISKLEELETYEISKDGDKYYLTRKDGNEEKIKTSLGLPCDLPTDAAVECNVSAEQAKSVKFDGRESNKPTVQFVLKIEKTNDETLYPFGYKFTLVSEKEVTISTSNSVKANTNTLFKIKKGNENALTLEKAWTIDKLLEKVELKGCTSDNSECSIKDSGTLKIKRDDKTISATSLGSSGKIKFTNGQAGYNQGFKFTVAESDITLSGNGVSEPNNKLEELETYEITEEGSNYYLSKKTSKEDSIKTSLSIPDKCFTSDSSCSNLTTSELLNIKLDGKSSGLPSVSNGSASLTVSKVTNTSDFPLGYKFTFLTTGEMTISSSSSPSSVKANIPTEFKIKKGSTPSDLTLEKAWTVEKLLEKVGLEGCSNGSADCNIKSSSPNGLNVKQGNTTYDTKTKSTSSTGKIKLYKDEAGYREGMKFVIEENDVTLTNTGSSDIKLTQYETYEIEQKGDKYYLSRKTDGTGEKMKKLGFPDGKCNWTNATSTQQTCSITLEELKNVNFKNKKEPQDSSSSTGGSVLVGVESADGSTHPLGLKVSLILTPASGSSGTSSNVNISLNGSSNGGAIVLKPNTKKEFKINKENGNGGNLSLERAFDINSFAGDAGLQNCYDNIGCSLKEKINVWMGENEYRVDAPVDSGSTSHKVTYEEGKSGSYNKGVKFTLSNDITLQNNTSGTDGGVQTGNITSLSKNDEYQIIKRTVNGSGEKCFLAKVTSGSNGRRS